MKQKNIIHSSQWLILLSFALVQLVPLAVKLIWSTWSGTPEKWILTISVQLVAILIPAWIFSNLYPADLYIYKLYEIKPVKAVSIIICIISGIALQFVSIVANAPLIALLGKTGEYVPPPSDAEGYMIAICSVILVPVICEELLFRGVFLSAQLERGAVKAIVFTTLVFALFHHDVTDITGNILLGLCLSYAAISTGTVLSSMIIHLCYNGTGFLLEYALYPYFDDTLYYISAALAVPVLIIAYKKSKLGVDYMIDSSYLTKTSRRRKSKLKPIIILCITIVTGWWLYNVASDVFGFAGDTDEKTVIIPFGSSSDTIGRILTENGIIDYPLLFQAFTRLEKDTGFKSGEFKLTSNMGYSEIAKAISEIPNSSGTKVVIPEGFESWLIGTELEKNSLISKDVFLEAIEKESFDYEFLEGITRRTSKLEGYLFPATYTFEKGVTSREVIIQMLRKFDSEFTAEMKDKAKKLNMTIDQVVTLASIIEREAKNNEDMLNVSSVFHNRLKIGQMLESCATVQFVLQERKPVLSEQDTRTPSDYNTYLHKGLPPGPICNPGKAALLAALNPSSTDFYYFVLSKDGSRHIYSKTYAEHLKAVKENQ